MFQRCSEINQINTKVRCVKYTQPLKGGYRKSVEERRGKEWEEERELDLARRSRHPPLSFNRQMGVQTGLNIPTHTIPERGRNILQNTR